MKLEDKYSVFLTEYTQNDGEEATLELLTRALLPKEVQLQTIQGALTDLACISLQNRSDLTNVNLARVMQARSGLQKFMLPYTDRLQVFEAIPIIYGSLIFFDPVNLDPDHSILSLKLSDFEEQFIYNLIIKSQIEQQLPIYWELYQMTSMASTHTDVINASRIMNECESLFHQTPVLAEYALIDIGIILTCEPLFDKDRDQLMHIKDRVMGWLDESSNPMMLGLVLYELQKCLELRLQRGNQRVA